MYLNVSSQGFRSEPPGPAFLTYQENVKMLPALSCPLSSGSGLIFWWFTGCFLEPELLRHGGKGAGSFTQSDVQTLPDKDVGDDSDGVGDGVGDEWEGGEVRLERE